MQSSALSQVINSGETEVTVPLPVQSSRAAHTFRGSR
jgi:hypothetical protein